MSQLELELELELEVYPSPCRAQAVDFDRPGCGAKTPLASGGVNLWNGYVCASLVTMDGGRFKVITEGGNFRLVVSIEKGLHH